jgi:hypothetical protein
MEVMLAQCPSTLSRKHPRPLPQKEEESYGYALSDAPDLLEGESFRQTTALLNSLPSKIPA